MSNDAETAAELIARIVAEFELPAITGNNDKQIAWATDIRNRALDRAIRVIVTIDRELASRHVQSRPNLAREFREARALLIGAFTSLTYGPWIIHFRGALEAGSLAYAFTHLEVVSLADYHRLMLDVRWSHVDRQAQLMLIDLPAVIGAPAPRS